MNGSSKLILSFVVLSCAAASASAGGAGKAPARGPKHPPWGEAKHTMLGDRVKVRQSRTWTLKEPEVANDVFPHAKQDSGKERILHLALIHLDTAPIPPHLRQQAIDIVFAAARSSEAPVPTVGLANQRTSSMSRRYQERKVASFHIESPLGELTLQHGGLTIVEPAKDGVHVTRTLSGDTETEERIEPLRTESLTRFEEILRETRSKP